MNRRQIRVIGSNQNCKKLRNCTKGTRSKIGLIVAVTMLASVKYASSFTVKLQALVNSPPVACATSINRYTGRIASHGIVRYQSSRLRRDNSPTDSVDNTALPPILEVEGLFAVDKPLEWTSQDVVSFVRFMFERDARSRGAKPGKLGSRNNRHLQVVRCGHGGTLDPLATGVLVIGLGNGTKSLQR
jgi:hypothetical protein